MFDSNNHHHAIEVRQLKKVFRKRKRQGFFKYAINEQWAVKDVSFEVAHGETYGLLGPNGSGKSTLIRILSTLLIPDHGEVRLMGHRLPDEESAVRWKIGRVSVDAAFYKKLSARENLLYSAYLTASSRSGPGSARSKFSNGWASSRGGFQIRSKR